MNLERMESLCRDYLSQSIQPLAPVQAVLSHLRDAGGFDELSKHQLVEFLGQHPEFELMPGPSDDDPVTVEAFAAAGFLMGPRVILRTRVPGPAELARLFRDQIASIEELVERALIAATADGDAKRAGSLREAAGRAKALKKKLDD